MYQLTDNFYDKLRQLRLTCTLQFLADKTGMSLTRMYRIEQRSNKRVHVSLREIEQFLNSGLITIEELINDETR